MTNRIQQFLVPTPEVNEETAPMLRKWWFENGCLIGRTFNNPPYPEGTLIRTGKIKEMNSKVLRTIDGATYRLG